MPDRHLVGGEWIEVPDCITAQGGPAVEQFLTLSPDERQREIALAEQAAQRRHAAARAVWEAEQGALSRPTTPPSPTEPDQATEE
jgi:hypothetical protein